jgi:diguanylate cyclase (GGDEF)-like protein
MMEVGFMVGRKLAVPLSGDAPPTPSRLLRFLRPLKPLHPGRSAAGFVLLAAALALVPLLLATLAFGRAFRSSETDRADARLVTATRVAFDRIENAAAAAQVAARKLAASPTLQAALTAHDGAALHALRYTRDGLTVIPAEHRAGPPPVPPSGLLRTVLIVRGGVTLGRVDAVLDVTPRVAAAAAATHTDVALAGTVGVQSGRLKSWPAAVPSDRVLDVVVHGQGYRILRTPFGAGLALVALVPDRTIAASVRHRQLLVFAAGALTVVALALAGLLLHQRGILRGRRRHRSSVALVGDVAAAAHDPRALLPVLLETAVVALDAAGGSVVWDGEQIASIGSATPGGHALVLSLDDEGGDRRQVVLHPPRGGFSASDLDVANSLVAQGRIAIENARLHTVVRRQAVTDELTDLANRRRFMEVLQHEVARALRFDTPLALVLFDLDHFKQINDRYGHQAGDDVLRLAARVIRERVRETDLPARIGGEEFAVILTGTGGAGALAVAEQLRHDLSEHVHVSDQDWTLTASFGVAVLHEGDTAELLIGAADRALYQAKADGRNVVRAEAEASSAA